MRSTSTLLRQGPGPKLAFLATADAEAIAEGLTALANTEGGQLVLGIGADGAYVRMSLTDTTAVMLSARYESQAFRLNRRNIVPEGIFSEQRVPVGVQFEWSPADGVYLVAHVDGIPWHRYDVRDKSGNRGNGVVADPTLAGGFGVAFNF